MQIHELDNYSGNLDDSSYLAIDNGMDTGKVSAAALLAETKNEINDLDTTLNARIDNIIAGGDAPSAAEVTDARQGTQGVVYASLGDAIRSQVGELQNDLEEAQDNGLFHRYLTWEHGGIDNATGLNNNEGSLVRSRIAEFYKTDEYAKVVNNTSTWAYVIYYNENQSFVDSAAVTAGSEVAIEVSSTHVYFRLDLRAGLNETNDIILYQISSLASYKGKTNWQFYCQFYPLEDNIYIEENKNTKKLYFSIYSLSVRYGANGTVISSRDRTMSQLADEVGTSLVTSPEGKTNCIELNDEYLLAFNVTTKLFEIIHRYSLTNDYVVLLAQNGGLVVEAASSILKAMISQKETTPEGIPSYWSSAISEAETSINYALTLDEKSASFGFVTDTHIGINKGYSGKLLNKVMSDCHIPVWFHGGDAVSGNGIISKSALIDEMNADFAQFAEIENIGLRAIGNHDPVFGVTNNYDSNLKDAEINHYYHGVDREKYLQIYGDEKSYFYKDIHKDKLRCICLNIIAYESQVNSADLVTGANKVYYHQFGSEQLAWFADVLASTPKDYLVVVCSHIAPVSLAELQTIDPSWMESTPIDYLQARKIAEAYKQKSSYAFTGSLTGDLTGDSYNINVDFSSAEGEFVCWFCGHTHKDFDLKLDHILIVGTANDSIAVSSNAPAYAPSKTAGTNTEHIIDFFCIIPSIKSVSVIRLGAYLPANGKVRDFVY